MVIVVFIDVFVFLFKISGNLKICLICFCNILFFFKAFLVLIICRILCKWRKFCVIIFFMFLIIFLKRVKLILLSEIFFDVRLFICFF